MSKFTKVEETKAYVIWEGTPSEDWKYESFIASGGRETHSGYMISGSDIVVNDEQLNLLKTEFLNKKCQFLATAEYGRMDEGDYVDFHLVIDVNIGEITIVQKFYHVYPTKIWEFVFNIFTKVFGQ